LLHGKRWSESVDAGGHCLVLGIEFFPESKSVKVKTIAFLDKLFSGEQNLARPLLKNLFQASLTVADA